MSNTRKRRNALVVWLSDHEEERLVQEAGIRQISKSELIRLLIATLPDPKKDQDQ